MALKSPVTDMPIITLPPSKWDVMTAIRRTQLQARLAWTSAKIEITPCLGVASSSVLVNGEVVDYPCYSHFIRDGVSGVTVIPSFDRYSKLWMGSNMINPFLFTFWHNSIVMQRSGWFTEYYGAVMETLDEQIVIWGADDATRRSKLYGLIVAFSESLRLLIKVI